MEGIVAYLDDDSFSSASDKDDETNNLQTRDDRNDLTNNVKTKPKESLQCGRKYADDQDNGSVTNSIVDGATTRNHEEQKNKAVPEQPHYHRRQQQKRKPQHEQNHHPLEMMTNANKKNQIRPVKPPHKQDQIRILTDEEAHRQEPGLFFRNEPHVRGNWSGLVYIVVGPPPSSENQHNKHRISMGYNAAPHDEESISGSDSDSNNFSQQENEFWTKWKQESYHQACQWIVKNEIDENMKCPSEQITQNKAKPSNSIKKKVLVVHKEPHISLTRNFYLQATSIPSFLRNLQQLVVARSSKNSLGCSHDSTVISLTNHPMLRLVNDSKTRAFFAWPVVGDLKSAAATATAYPANTNQQGYSKNHIQDLSSSSSSKAIVFLNRLVQELNELLQQYQQQPFYDPPLFHASFASTPLIHRVEPSQRKDQYQNYEYPKKRRKPENSSTKTGLNDTGTAKFNTIQECNVLGDPASPPNVTIIPNENQQDSTSTNGPSCEDNCCWEFEVTKIHCRLGDKIYVYNL